MDCLIIGGGAIGMMTARELSRAGCQVRVLERGEVGHESSWAGGGILSPLSPWRAPDSLFPLAQWSAQHYPELVEGLLARTGIDAELIKSGYLLLDAAETKAPVEWAQRHHVRLEVLDGPEAVAGIEPNCRRAENGLWFPDVAQVRNPRLLQALRRDLLQSGVQITSHQTVQGIALEGGRARGVRVWDGLIEADVIIVAAGAWTATLLGSIGLRIEVTPIKGQMLLYATGPALRTIVSDGDRYVIPRREGRVLVGSTLEQTGFDKSVTAEARGELERVAERLVPALAQHPVEQQWAGLRPGSPRGIPSIGAVPGVEGLYVNTGHFRNGLLLAPASARLLADLIVGRAPLVDPSPFAPALTTSIHRA